LLHTAHQATICTPKRSASVEAKTDRQPSAQHSTPTILEAPQLKLIVQIPCLNEAKTLATTLASLPRQVPGFDCVEWLVIDDGSTDATERIARENGVDHVVRHAANLGLARAFMTGLDAALRLGADVIVNTDADNQYNADDIPALTAPIVEGRADLVIGARPITSIDHFSAPKKLLQRLGSWVVRLASDTDIHDAPSGFRAFSRTAAQRLMVFNNYTYTLETIIQAGRKNMAVASVAIRVNEDLRPSRLVKSTSSYVKRSIVTIVRIFVIYRPFHFFLTIAALLFLPGLLLGLRFLWFWLSGDGRGHIQSLLLSTLLMGSGFLTLLIAFVADLLAANRQLLEDIRFKVNLLTQDSDGGANLESRTAATQDAVSPTKATK
jgi:glycosyltransferase involved in cell wall biosynthesis